MNGFAVEWSQSAGRAAAAHTLPAQGIRDAVRHESTAADNPERLRPELSWTHYRLLLGNKSITISAR